ncbi:MAG TPA: head GIN domain-containing protein [Burkholderiaceae bacterium]|jgi:hypothetical protein
MKRFILSLALIGAFSGVFTSAYAQDGKTYAPGPFDRLEIDGSAQVSISQGERDQVFIRGDDDVQQSVEVSLDGKRLSVHPTGSWKFWRSQRLQITVQMRQLRMLTLSGASDLKMDGPIKSDRLDIHVSGAGNVRADALDVGELRFEISGAGDGDLAGQVGKLGMTISGTGKLKAENLKAGRANVSISGAGSARLWVVDGIKVSISGIGDVDYWGKPTDVSRSTAGLGSITAHGEKR